MTFDARTTTKGGRPDKKSNFRKLPVTVNLQTLRDKLETSNGKLLEVEKRKIVNLVVNLSFNKLFLFDKSIKHILVRKREAQEVSRSSPKGH